MVSALLPVTLDAVELRRGGRVILGPLSLSIAGAGITVVMGPNGSGKTSLLRAMHGLERVTRGRITWAEGDQRRVRAAQAFVFQSPVIMRRSVLDSIAFPLRLDGVGRKPARARAAAAGGDFGLAAHLDQPAESLSGGERQKMALARALIREPALLFLDEPCANLDPRAVAEFESYLRRACGRGLRIVMSTHDVGQARRLADEVVFLRDGQMLDFLPAPAFFSGGASAAAQAHLRGDLLL